ncbi:MAG: isoamylase early set domain-containing protein [Ignavibacteriaceae bacterium]|nr:isoamylase early set domain-containing protein [Ignavibacteriaceae bacterium]
MLKKKYSKKDNSCDVTFILSPGVDAKSAFLCGDFNNWDKTATKMDFSEKEGFSVTLKLKIGTSYRFRYYLDDERWENDWQSDSYYPNEFGSEDSVVEL